MNECLLYFNLFISVLSNELQTIVKSMMAPNPVKRPDVYELLSYHKLNDLRIKRRPKWWHLKKMVNLFFYLICNHF